MLNLNGKSILITGGTGSFGKMFTKLILDRNPDVKKLVILSRDEQKHFQMAQEFPEHKYPAMRYFLYLLMTDGVYPQNEVQDRCKAT